MGLPDSEHNRKEEEARQSSDRSDTHARGSTDGMTGVNERLDEMT
jgi:hypothetical protein